MFHFYQARLPGLHDRLFLQHPSGLRSEICISSQHAPQPCAEFESLRRTGMQTFACESTVLWSEALWRMLVCSAFYLVCNGCELSLSSRSLLASSNALLPDPIVAVIRTFCCFFRLLISRFLFRCYRVLCCSRQSSGKGV